MENHKTHVKNMYRRGRSLEPNLNAAHISHNNSFDANRLMKWPHQTNLRQTFQRPESTEQINVQ